MKNYLVKIKVNNPYPKEYQERVEASNAGLAAYRGYKKVKQNEFNKLKGKRIKEWDFKVITLI